MKRTQHRGFLGMVARWLSHVARSGTIHLLLFLLFASVVHAQVLIKEVVSREVSIHVGGVQTPEIKEIVSREASLFIENGRPDKEVVSREVSFVVGTTAAPPQVTEILVTPSPTGDSVFLDWTSYNPWAVRDIARFDIYISDTPFTDVTTMTRKTFVGGETVTATVTGLTPFQDHYIAIVAVDVLGNRNTAVIYSAAYIISPQVISREVSLFVGDEPNPPYKEVVSREVSLAVGTAAAPPQVTGYTVTPSPTGDSVTLDWTSYNPWAVKDVAYFDIYVEDAPFSDVGTLVRKLRAGGETTTATVTGLTQLRDHFIAIVAVDVLGNRNTAVINSAAYILSPQVISREVSLFVGDEPTPPYREVVSREASILVPDATVPAPVTGIGSGFTAVTSATRYRAIDLDWSTYNELLQRDVVQYRVYTDTSFFTNVTGMPFTTVPAGTQKTTAIVPAGNQTYYIAVVAEDALGQFNATVTSVSAQSSINDVWEPTANSVTYNGLVLPNGATIRAAGTLQVDATVAAAIVRVDFSVRPAVGVDVLLASDTTPGDGFTASFDALAYADGPYVFTFRAFDNVGRYTELTRPVTLRYNFPPVIAALTYGAGNLLDGATLTQSARFGVTAIDTDGIGLAEFFYQAVGSATRALIGTDSNISDGLDAPLSLESLADGSYDLIARVTDTLGTSTEASRRVNVLLAVPLAPVITAPTGTTTVTTATVQVQGTAPLNATLKLYANATIVFSGSPAANGTFNVPVTLADGANDIYAESSNRAGPSPRSNSVTVTKVDPPPVLGLSLAASSVVEGGSVNGTVSIDRVRTQAFTIALGVSQSGRITFPATVVIPAGQLSAPFTVLSVQNQNVEAPVTMTLIASATGSTAVTAALQILDDDTPAIQFTLNQTVVSENAGANAVQGLLTLSSASPSATSATFTATPAGQVVLPQSISIPANAQSASVPITIADNNVVDGNRTVTITAHLVAGGTVVADALPVDLGITDDEGPSLSLAFDRTLFVEGRNPAGSGIVTRNASGGPAVSVSLTSSNPAKFIVPATVTIPAGQAAATFPIQTINDGQPNGSQTITLTATGAGYNPGTASVTLTDLQKPDLTVALLNPLTGAETESWIDVPLLMSNQGATDAVGPFTQRILLSSDATIGNDLLLGQEDFTGRLSAGASIQQTLRVKLPRTASRYWLVVQTDVNNAIDEALEDNNAAIAATPLDVAPAYSATLSIVPATVPAGTAIPITGTAMLQAGGAAQYVLVNIHITNQGVKRVISALTNSLGQFTSSFTPLVGEGGLFQFGAAHPGTNTATVQDEVRVYGLRAEPASVELSLAETSSQTGSITLRNLADLPLSGLFTSVTGVPAGIQFVPTLSATSIAGSGTVSLNYNVTSNGPLDHKTFTVAINSAEGATVPVQVGITVAANVPKLVADPGQLFVGMVRGSQQVVNFTLRNDGKAPTSPVNLLIPRAVGWMRVTTPLLIPAIAPGASASVGIQLTPPADLALGDHAGSFVATDGTTSATIPFRFRALSDQTGQLIVSAEDEYTYYASGNPPLAGATVKVTDALTGAVAGTGTTTASGAIDFGQIPEGYYTIDVTAAQHTGYHATHLVEGGKDHVVPAFLSRQTLTYTWTVVPVQVEDRYSVTIDATFETVVPIPVVIVEPTVIDLAQITTAETVVNVKLSNHGLVAAESTRLIFPTHPLWQFTPTVEQIGTLPAMSSITVPLTIRKLGDIAGMSKTQDPPTRAVNPLPVPPPPPDDLGLFVN